MRGFAKSDTDMAAQTDRFNKPTVEIGGKVVEVFDISINPGNDIEIRENAIGLQHFSLVRTSPSISLERCSIADFAMHETNDVRLVFSARKRWKFPDEPFVSYDKSDEEWCRYFGIGHEVDYTPVIEMKNALVDFADYDRVRFVGVVEQKNVDVTV